jgi:hypothetical protein
MIGRKGLEGGWCTPLHATADWPGYFPGARIALGVLLEPGLSPTMTPAALDLRRRFTGRPAPMT